MRHFCSALQNRNHRWFSFDLVHDFCSEVAGPHSIPVERSWEVAHSCIFERANLADSAAWTKKASAKPWTLPVESMEKDMVFTDLQQSFNLQEMKEHSLWTVNDNWQFIRRCGTTFSRSCLDYTGLYGVFGLRQILLHDTSRLNARASPTVLTVSWLYQWVGGWGSSTISTRGSCWYGANGQRVETPCVYPTKVRTKVT